VTWYITSWIGSCYADVGLPRHESHQLPYDVFEAGAVDNFDHRRQHVPRENVIVPWKAVPGLLLERIFAGEPDNGAESADIRIESVVEQSAGMAQQLPQRDAGTPVATEIRQKPAGCVIEFCLAHIDGTGQAAGNQRLHRAVKPRNVGRGGGPCNTAPTYCHVSGYPPVDPSEDLAAQTVAPVGPLTEQSRGGGNGRIRRG